MATTNYQILRGAKVEFGTSNAGLPATYGTLLSASTDTQAKSVEVPNPDGQTVDVVIYDETTTISLTCLFKTDMGDTAPKVGDSVTVDSITGIITGVKHDWSNSALRQMTLSATSWKHLTPPTPTQS